VAIHDVIFHPGAFRATRTQVGAAASSAELAVNTAESWVFIADLPVHVRFGATGLGAADATDLLMPANTHVVWNLGILQDITHVRVFNPDVATTVNFFRFPLARS